MIELALPSKPYCANTFRNTKIRPAEMAAEHVYIQLNHTRAWIRYLIFDVDREGAAFAWEDAKLPPPSFAVVNPENAHAHLVWELENPVWISEKSRERPQMLLAAIREAYTKALGADPGFTGLLTKNPNHSKWRTIVFTSHKYSLVELATECPVALPYPAAGTVEAGQPLKRIEPDDERLPLGRNATVFELGRFYAYELVKTVRDYETHHDEITAKLGEINSKFDVQLSETELGHIVKHIAEWTWRRRHSFGRSDRDEGAMGFDTMRGLSHEEYIKETKKRQAAGGKYAAAKRKKQTMDSLRSAILQIRLNGTKVSQAAVASIAKKALITVKRYWSSLFFTLGINQSIQFIALDGRVEVSETRLVNEGSQEGEFELGFEESQQKKDLKKEKAKPDE